MAEWKQRDIDRLKERGIRVIDTKNKPQPVQAAKPASFALGRMMAGNMNKTESAYAGYLEALKQTGEVLWYEFEPMNLRIGENCYYRVDFLVMVKSGQLEAHEVKGYWTDDALVKIKAAAAKFPFRFIAVKHVKGEWRVREF